MMKCDDLIEQFHAEARDHVQLAVIAPAPPVAEMHIDLAIFSKERAQIAEQICEDA